MSAPGFRTTVATVLVAALVLTGLWQTGSGVWIYVKANLAQVLLQRAWADTLAGKQNAKPWPWADTWPVARLRVPSKGIDVIVLNGAYGRTLAFGPGYAESSAFPGSPGTTIFTGHRDTHFGFLKQLKPRDEIVMETAAGTRQRFLVENLFVVDSRATSILLDREHTQLVLVTCYPFDAIVPGGSLRYVVEAAADRHT